MNAPDFSAFAPQQETPQLLQEFPTPRVPNRTARIKPPKIVTTR
jgi:hypothetical protein